MHTHTGLSTGEWSDKLGACTECTLKGCEVCSTEKTCSKCNAESLLLDNGTCGSIPKSCADLYAQGKRKNGIYRLTSGDAKQTYKQHCILEDTDHYTGGWTRFVRVEPGYAFDDAYYFCFYSSWAAWWWDERIFISVCRLRCGVRCHSMCADVRRRLFVASQQVRITQRF